MIRIYLLLLGACTNLTSSILLPEPSGPFNVAMRIQSFNDTTRSDPLDPSRDSKSRRLLTSIFLPVEKQDTCSKQAVPYMTPAVAAAYGPEAASIGLPKDFFSVFQINFCRLPSSQPGCVSKIKRGRAFPVLFFDPGFGESRLLYGAMARSLSSHGFVVVTVDHPFDASAVEFPDGTTILGADISDEDPASLVKVVKTRSDDMKFVLNALHDHKFTNSLLSGYGSKLDLSKTFVIGHSLGGAAAAALTRDDKRIIGGINLDGRLVDPALSKGLNKPFLLTGRPGHNKEDPTWNAFWPNLHGRSLELAINGSLHATYTDRPILLGAANLPPPAMEASKGILGTIDIKRFDKILNGVVNSFTNYAVDRQSKSFEKLYKTFAEILVVREKK